MLDHLGVESRLRRAQGKVALMNDQAQDRAALLDGYFGNFGKLR